MALRTRSAFINNLSWLRGVLTLIGIEAVILVAISAIDPALKKSLNPLNVSAILGMSAILYGGILLVWFRKLEHGLLEPLSKVVEATNAKIHGAKEGDVEDYDSHYTEILSLVEAINKLSAKSVHDINNMRKLEKVRSEFIGNVSHELRTPVFSVQGYLETLLDGAINEPEVSRLFVEKAYSNAMRLNSLLSDLIDITKIESGELKLSFRYLNIYDLIRDTVQSLELKAEQKSVSVVVDPKMSEDLEVYGDRERIVQVLTNLIDNAIKYNKQNGSVLISAQEKDEIARITVSDTGIGIPEEAQPRIFERFYRVDKDRSRGVGGTGLGLSIVKHILEAHGSKVSVESASGMGTSVTFTLKA